MAKDNSPKIQFDEKTGEVRVVFNDQTILLPEQYKTKNKAIKAGEKYLSRLKKGSS